MPREFKLADPGEGIHEAEVLEVHVAPGEEVEEGQILLVVETDKAAVEIPSPFTGTVESVPVEVGQVVEVGAVLVTYREAGEEADERPGEEPETPQARPRRRARAAKAAAPDEEAAAHEAGEGEAKRGREGPIPASPATRRLARELGVDLAAVEASGPEGRVLAEDVRRHAEGERPEAAPARPEPRAEERAPEAAEARPDADRFGPIERIRLRGVRRASARRMAQAWREIPHVTHTETADVTALEDLRRRHGRERGEEPTPSLTAFVLKAAAAALREHPRFNASLEAEDAQIVLKRYRHLGVAVDTERGLLVPVVRDVDHLSTLAVNERLAALVEKARAGDLTREEMQGGTFTVTNPGPLGGVHFTPIINPPQVAILGVARTRLEPVAVGDPETFEVRAQARLPLILAFDHRVNDGADAARFLADVAAMLSSPDTFAVRV